MKPFFFILCLTISLGLMAQEDKGIHLTTGVGINEIQGKLGNTFKSTIAFNSGFEKAFRKNWFAQLELNFNSLRYDQQEKDDASPYLYQNTNSSLFMISGNWGYDFRLAKSPWFYSLYAGAGYLNLGKPHVLIDDANNIVTQITVRRSGILGKAGNRIGVNTKSGFLQTVYLDASWWTTSVHVEGERFNSVSVFLGIRMAMQSKNEVVKRHLKTVKELN